MRYTWAMFATEYFVFRPFQSGEYLLGGIHLVLLCGSSYFPVLSTLPLLSPSLSTLSVLVIFNGTELVSESFTSGFEDGVDG